jgi:hypothetical protein
MLPATRKPLSEKNIGNSSALTTPIQPASTACMASVSPDT